MLNSPKSIKTLVLGLGNLLLADEGVGVHVAQELAGRINSNDVVVVDVGTAILDVMPQLRNAERIIVIDACKGDSKPGTVYCLNLDECEGKQFIGSVHGFDLKCVLAMTGRRTVPVVTVIGIEPERIGWSMELSPVVAKVVPEVIVLVEKMVRSGVEAVLLELTGSRGAASQQKEGACLVWEWAN